MIPKQHVKKCKPGPVIIQPSIEESCRKRSRLEHASSLCLAQTTLINVTGSKPLAALELLDRNLPRDAEARDHWKSCARVAAIMGSCPGSLPSFKSGLKHWLRYIEIFYGKEQVDQMAFPPRLDDVLAWSNTFR